MAAAYATLADGGVRHDADRDRQGRLPRRQGRRAEPQRRASACSPPGEAYEVTKVLEGVITSGTGAGYTSIGCRSEAGKTGTTDGPVRRLVRRLHAALLDRGLDRAPALARLHRLRRPDLRADLALLHGGRPGPATAPTSRFPRALPSLSAFHGEHTASSSSSCSSSYELVLLRLLVHAELRRQRQRRRSDSGRAPTRRGWARNRRRHRSRNRRRRRRRRHHRRPRRRPAAV